MPSSRDEVENLLAQIRECAPGVAGLADQVSVLCRAAFVPAAQERWESCGLTRLESRLMRCLAEHLDRTMAKGILMDALYFDRPHEEPQAKIVDILVCKIRRKLRGSSYVIETVWGQGYRARAAQPGEIQNQADTAVPAAVSTHQIATRIQ